jgi:nickel superoxide dismutase
MKFTKMIQTVFPATEIVEAHCDGPCGVYDPASARIAAEAALSMTKKLLALGHPDQDNKLETTEYHNTTTRYVLIKEEQAHIAKTEVLVLWTDYFKPVHLETYPDLHNLIWETTKLCSEVKQHVNLDAANQLMGNIEKIHDIFWATKGRDVAYYVAS